MIERMGLSQYEYALKTEKISPRPLAYMRGATFSDAFVILDEAQNCTPAEMKMFLTRIGRNCTVVVDGDPAQCDLNGPSGLDDAVRRLEGIPGVEVVEFTEDDIVRSGIIKDILVAYRR
jgi:phosphate starvation-inducible PhoH-like protein